MGGRGVSLWKGQGVGRDPWFLAAAPLPHRGTVKASGAQRARKTTIGYSYPPRRAGRARSAPLAGGAARRAAKLAVWGPRTRSTQVSGYAQGTPLTKPRWKAGGGEPALPSKPDLLERKAPSRPPPLAQPPSRPTPTPPTRVSQAQRPPTPTSPLAARRPRTSPSPGPRNSQSVRVERGPLPG